MREGGGRGEGQTNKYLGEGEERQATMSTFSGVSLPPQAQCCFNMMRK